MPSVRTELYLTTRQKYDKQGRLRIETFAQAIERNVLTGRIVRRTSAKYNVQEDIVRIANQMNTGELSGKRAFSIIESHGKHSSEKMVRNAMNSIVTMYEDKIPISDYDMDRLKYLMNHFKDNWEDFENFYRQNPRVVQNVYRVGSPRASERDREIVMPTEFDRRNTIDALLDAMQNYLDISDAEMNANVNPKNYKASGVRIKGRVIHKFDTTFYGN